MSYDTNFKKRDSIDESGSSGVSHTYYYNKFNIVYRNHLNLEKLIKV
jgi:hypothetical protein